MILSAFQVLDIVNQLQSVAKVAFFGLLNMLEIHKRMTSCVTTIRHFPNKILGCHSGGEYLKGVK